MSVSRADMDGARLFQELPARLNAVLSKLVPNQRAAAWAQDHAGDLIADVSPRVRRAVRELIVDGLKRGVSQGELAADLEALGFDPAHAALIARTEYRAAVEAARQAAWDDAQGRGRLTDRATKTWRTRGQAPCRICKPLDGQQQFVELPFDTAVGPVMSPPAHPGCLCGATLTAR